MRCAVFRGIGGTANKYYLLFQHHLAPPPSTFTTGRSSTQDIEMSANAFEDAPQTMSENGAGLDLRQVEDTYVLEEKTIDSSYIIGSKPGVSLYRMSMRVKLTSIALCSRTFAEYLCETRCQDSLLRH
jgi:hypothetical protein